MGKTRGFTLIELVLFIVILGVLGTGILSALSVALQSSPDIQYAAQASELAQQRMDLILGQKVIYGFDGTQDPCVATPGLSVCSIPAGYTVSSSITNNWDGDTNFKTITVTVSGLSSITLTSMVANYAG